VVSLIKEHCETRPIKPPKNIGELEDQIFVSNKDFFSIEIYNYPKAYVTGSGICFNRFLQLLKGSHSCIPEVKKEQHKIALFNFFLRKRIAFKSEKRFLVVHNQWYSGYFHWLIDSLTRLFAVEQLHDKLCLLLPEKARTISFVQQTLDLFPRLEKKYIPFDRLAMVKNLAVPSHLPGRGMYLSEKTKALRDYILSALNLMNSEAGKKIYISRKSASRRKVINEAEVLELISKNNFEEVILEELNFSEQVKLFASSQTVLSIHGAGLSNIIFMKEGTNVIEILKKPYNNQSYELDYHILSSEFELNYYALIGVPENINDSFDNADLFVNIPELKKMLVEIDSKATV
jgi:capsular polysaccharide biosynthesis protein